MSRWVTKDEYDVIMILQIVVAIVKIVIFSIFIAIGVLMLFFKFLGYLKKRFPLFFKAMICALIIEVFLFLLSATIDDYLPIHVFMLGIDDKVVQFSEFFMELSLNFWGEDSYFLNWITSMFLGVSGLVVSICVEILIVPCAYGALINFAYFTYCHFSGNEYQYTPRLYEGDDEFETKNMPTKTMIPDKKETSNPTVTKTIYPSTNKLATTNTIKTNNPKSNEILECSQKMMKAKSIAEKYTNEVYPILKKKPNALVEMEMKRLEESIQNMNVAYASLQKNNSSAASDKQINDAVMRVKIKIQQTNEASNKVYAALKKAYGK